MNEVLELFKNTRNIENSSFPTNTELLTRIMSASECTALPQPSEASVEKKRAEVKII